MRWYSASTWEENLPIHPDDPKFSQQFACVPGDDAIPHTSKQNLPHKQVIRKWAEAAKQFFKEEQDLEGSQMSFHVLKQRVLSSLEISTPKHHIKLGPVKSSKKIKLKTKDMTSKPLKLLE